MAETAPAATRAVLTSGVYSVAWPVVFARLTSVIEARRGHPTCARSVYKLADGCLDRFHDDVEAVVEDVLAHANLQIHNLEAWITSRLRAATVDGYRRRRGRRGALQRPRVPGWLSRLLGGDRWLLVLAIEILEWVGVETTAGAALWPFDGWAQRRAEVTGDWAGSQPTVVGREVETVLAAMRHRPNWFQSYVERPLGRKQAPVMSVPMDSDASPWRMSELSLTEPEDAADARLTALATRAVIAIQDRLRRGEDPVQAVIQVIDAVFGPAPAGAGPSGQAPSDFRPGYGTRVSELLNDPVRAARVTAEILAMLDGRPAHR